MANGFFLNESQCYISRKNSKNYQHVNNLVTTKTITPKKTFSFLKILSQALAICRVEGETETLPVFDTVIFFAFQKANIFIQTSYLETIPEKVDCKVYGQVVT